MVIPALILILLFWIVLDVYGNYFYITFNNAWHKTQATLRTLLSGGMIYFAGREGQLALYSITFIWVYFLWAYWLLFDLGLNLKRKLPAYYVGNHSWMDKEITSIGKKVNIEIKFLPFIIKLVVLLIIIIGNIFIIKFWFN